MQVTVLFLLFCRLGQYLKYFSYRLLWVAQLLEAPAWVVPALRLNNIRCTFLIGGFVVFLDGGILALLFLFFLFRLFFLWLFFGLLFGHCTNIVFTTLLYFLSIFTDTMDKGRDPARPHYT